jgi:ABC-type multidrug transport system permease subunit
MEKNIIWLKTECKRAVYWLPLAVKRAVILAIGIIAVACMIAFCTLKYYEYNKRELVKINVGYVADDNMLTDLALSYIGDMESIKSICSIDKVSSEDKGLELLENGEISALVVLPDNVIDEINTGSNAHGTLYVQATNTSIDTGSGLSNVAVLLFEEIGRAGMGMLSTAQAEIYATYNLISDNSNEVTSEQLDSMYANIDKFNLAAVGQREKLFKTKSLSLTGNDTYVVYYGSALMTIYVMLVGVLFGEYYKRNLTGQFIAKRRMGVGLSYQLLCRYIAGVIIAATIVMLPILAICIQSVSLVGIIAILLVTIFMTISNILVFEFAQNEQAAVVIMGVNTILQSYLSGCIIPTVLLPDKIAALGELLPASFIKKAFRILMTRRKEDILQVLGGLIAWGVIIFLITIITIWFKNTQKAVLGRRIKLNKNGKYHIPSITMVVFRRFLHKKSIWVCLIIIAVVSVLIVRTERKSDTNITVAFYDESGEYASLLEEYEGLVEFVNYGSEEDVKKAVLQDEVECGYVIPYNLTERMLSQMANGLVTVYQDNDAVAVNVVNEVIFERIFKYVSINWYKSYISKYNDGIDDKVEEVVDDKLNEGITFDIDVQMVGDGDLQTMPRFSYPVTFVILLTVAICGIYGVAQVASDICKKRFYRCKKSLIIYVQTLVIPILFGVVTGIIIIAIIVNMWQYSY